MIKTKIITTAKNINNENILIANDYTYLTLFKVNNKEFYLYSLYTKEDFTEPNIYEISKELFDDLLNKKVIVIPVTDFNEIAEILISTKVQSSSKILLDSIANKMDDLTVEQSIEIQKYLNNLKL